MSTPWDDAGERTKRYYVKKASEVVAESLKVIAGEESDKLWETMVSSRAMKQHFSLASSGTEEVDLTLLESLVECYNNATQWHTRRQILSLQVPSTVYSKPIALSFQDCQTAPIAAW